MKHTHRQRQRRSIRLRDYDYSQEGAYFVTICTHNKALLFENEAIRAIVEQCWLEIPDHFPNIEIDAFVVMPNHIHGIVSIVDNCRGKVASPARKGAETAPLRN